MEILALLVKTGSAKLSLMAFPTLPTTFSLFKVLFWMILLQALPTSLADSAPNTTETTVLSTLKLMGTKEVCRLPCSTGETYARILSMVLTLLTVYLLFYMTIGMRRLRAVLFLLWQLSQLPLAAAMERQPLREQAIIPERVERDVRWINRNAVFGLVLAMWGLGIIYKFLGLLSDGINLLVLFLPLGFALHSFNIALFPGQEVPPTDIAASETWSQWIPILSLIVFINSAITIPSRTKLHLVVCVITMLLGFAQITLENIQSHLPLWLVQAIHFVIVTTHFNIWYYTFVIVRRGAGN